MDKTQEKMIRAAAWAGVQAALATWDAQQRGGIQKSKTRDPRLRNAKLLLRHYRELREHANEAVYDALQATVSDEDIARLMRSLGGDVEFRVEAIQRSASKTALIMNHVENMLELWKASCFRSGRIEDQRRWRVVYNVYLAPLGKEKSIDEVAAEEHIDPRTVYKDIDAAAERLSVYFFGVDSILDE